MKLAPLINESVKFHDGDEIVIYREHRIPDTLPTEIAGSFNVFYSDITSLAGAPKKIGGSVTLTHNQNLDSLHDVHKHINHVGNMFNCSGAAIRSSVLGLMLIEIGGTITIQFENMEMYRNANQILNTWKNQGRRGVLGAQRELLDLGYDRLAQL